METDAANGPGSGDRMGLAGQLLSAAFVLGIGAICVVMIAGGTNTKQQLVPPEMVASRNPACPAPTAPIQWTSPTSPHIVFIVANENRGGRLRSYLLADTEVRTMLGEPLRDAEILAVATESEAQALAALIADQSAVPGTAPMVAVVVR